MLDHGIIASGYKGQENNVQVASVQTLVRRLKPLITNQINNY